nr:DUF397 domain-containing protein [Actinomadura atramentaria]
MLQSDTGPFSGRVPTVPLDSNEISAADLHGARWLKSRRSNSQGNCVEIAELPGDRIAMRNSRHPEGPALIYTRPEIEALILGAKDGDFDHLIAHGEN